MKKLLIPALAVAVASAALPAAAQSYGPPHDRHGPARGHSYEQDYRGWNSITQRKHSLDRRIDRGVETRRLSYREAARLKDELNSLVRLERDYMRGGLTRWERNDLERRYDRLSDKVRYESNDRDGRRH